MVSLKIIFYCLTRGGGAAAAAVAAAAVAVIILASIARCGNLPVRTGNNNKLVLFYYKTVSRDFGKNKRDCTVL